MTHLRYSIGGYAPCFVGTAITTESRQTHGRSSASAVKSSRHGIASYSGVASAADGRLRRPSVSKPIIRFPRRVSFILGPRDAFMLDRRPKVGARCGKSARRVLSGGRPEGAVPTGTAGGGPSRRTKGRPYRDRRTRSRPVRLPSFSAGPHRERYATSTRLFELMGMDIILIDSATTQRSRITSKIMENATLQVGPKPASERAEGVTEPRGIIARPADVPPGTPPRGD
jgi:hypothetical protein